jgi:hypothetical protein
MKFRLLTGFQTRRVRVEKEQVDEIGEARLRSDRIVEQCRDWSPELENVDFEL